MDGSESLSFVEGRQNAVTVECGDQSEAMAFERVVRFMYTGEHPTTLDNAFATLVAANYYQVKPLEHVCVTFLQNSLNSGNCCRHLAALEETFVPELFDVEC